MSRNVTITMEDDLLKRARMEAARCDKSLSQLMQESLTERLVRGSAEEEQFQADVLKRWLERPGVPILNEDGTMPDREARNSRF